MASLDEIPLSTSAYLGDTQHLSLPQHGAYLLILMAMWRAKGWIADDDTLLANICKLTPAKWRKISGPVRALLLVRDGKLSQKRLLLEFQKASKTVSKNAQNGRAGGIAKSLKSKKVGVATATVSPAVRQRVATNEAKDPTLFKEEERDSKEVSQKTESKKTRKKESKKDARARDEAVGGVDDGWPADYENQFWSSFPKKRRYDKPQVMALLARLRRDKTANWETIFGGVLRYAKSDLGPAGEFAKAPLPWLRGQRWEGDYGGANGTTGPPSRPAYKTPPPGCESREDFLERVRKANAEIEGKSAGRSTGVGQNGHDRPPELQLSSGDPLQRQERETRRRSPND